MTDPKSIPLDDASGSKDATFDYSSTPWPEPKIEPKTELDLSLPPPTFAPPGYTSYPTPYPVAPGAPIAPNDQWMVRFFLTHINIVNDNKSELCFKWCY